MEAFRSAFLPCNLIDLGYTRNKYTWNNGRHHGEFVQQRLDRAYATLEWRELFPHCRVTHLQAPYSDHIPILLTTHNTNISTQRKQFPHRFEEKWASHLDCEPVIQVAWNQVHPRGNPMFRLFEKIKHYRMALIGWSRYAFRDTKAKLEEKQKESEDLTKQKTGDKIESINMVKSEINRLLYQEELTWRQRSRAIWLQVGDKNTKFFDQRASQRRQRNQIIGVFNDEDNWCTDDNEIANVAENYFHNLFTTTHLDHTIMENVLDSVDRRITDDMNGILLQPYTACEIKRALFQMHLSKSPGPDGMSPFFFQKNWYIVGRDVIEAVLLILNSGHLLHKMNHTHIVLIPKKNDPKYLSEFRPIILSNVVSRIYSKVLINRLKIILPNVISDAQSAFGSDRLITNNTIVAFEVLHKMRNRRRGKRGHMAIKLDISKAYDRVEWPFLKRIMEKIGMDLKRIHLAMETVTTASYSILINGEPRGHIKPSRGIRQGDPLSPYLFLLCAEGLSAMLKRAEERRQLHGILSCKNGVQISHLLFVDDNLLFCQATVEDCQQLKTILEQYESASGQSINRSKIALFFSRNTRAEVRTTIQGILGAQVITDCEKYLGLPMVIGLSKVKSFKELKEKITKRVMGWKEKFISKAEREVLIKTVAQAIPTYTMGIFKIPISLCNDINAILAKYW